YQMGRCCGLCTGNVTPESYGELIRYATDILRGNVGNVRSEMEAQMYRYSDMEQYEMAAKYRDTIRALDALSEKQKVVAAPGTEQDVFGFFSDDAIPVLSGIFIRDGRVNDVSNFVFGADEITENGDLVTFLCEHYLKSEYIPQTVLLSFDPGVEEAELFAAYLTSLAGRKITVRVPERGERKKLCELADKNAEEHSYRSRRETEKDDSTLLRLAELLCLETLPERIEAYDISNLGEEHKTAGMVVVKNGAFSKSDYRSFSIRDVKGTDDYASMAEAIRRRLVHLRDESGSFSEFPDLILLDGGRGHVSTIRAVLREAGIEIPIYGMVKDDYHKTRALCTEDMEINIAKENRVFLLIYKIQEEVHRYSVSRMQTAKRNTLKHSSLEKIPGIGKVKAEKLLRAFGGLGKLKTATEAEIGAVKGISKKDAETIYTYFHPKES
ncbi:MAG: excinuclease ABC subunit C, partial [Clostridia bacterium]|nr:excinuclease ABC subunit C [Clostridia bacterium]